jgi:hypothetical protein
MPLEKCACCNVTIQAGAKKYLYGETKEGFPQLGGYLIKTKRVDVARKYGCNTCYLL